MHPLLKIALGAVLAAVIVRYAGRGTALRSLIERLTARDVPVLRPRVDEQFDSEIAPGAPF
jgi:hypothetical protein